MNPQQTQQPDFHSTASQLSTPPQAATFVAPTAKQKLAGFGTISGNAIRILKKRFTVALGGIALIAFAFGSIAVTVAMGAKAVAGSSSATIAFIVIIILGFALILIASTAILSAFVRHEENDGLSAALAIGARKAWPLFWTQLIYGFAVYGGMFLLFVPGIIVSLNGVFASIFALDGKCGSAAIARSASFAYGYRGKIFDRLFVLGLLMLIVNIGVAIGTTFLAKLVTPAASAIVDGIIGALISLFTFAFLIALFDATKEARRDIPLVKKPRWPYIVLALLSPFIVVGMFAMLFGSMLLPLLFMFHGGAGLQQTPTVPSTLSLQYGTTSLHQFPSTTLTTQTLAGTGTTDFSTSTDNTGDTNMNLAPTTTQVGTPGASILSEMTGARAAFPAEELVLKPLIMIPFTEKLPPEYASVRALMDSNLQAVTGYCYFRTDLCGNLIDALESTDQSCLRSPTSTAAATSCITASLGNAQKIIGASVILNTDNFGTNMSKLPLGETHKLFRDTAGTLYDVTYKSDGKVVNSTTKQTVAGGKTTYTMTSKAITP